MPATSSSRSRTYSLVSDVTLHVASCLPTAVADTSAEIYRIVSSKALDAGEVAPFSQEGGHRIDVTKPADTPSKEGKCC